MAAANTIGNPLSFTLFPQLPSELRCLIWEKALPPQPSTMMYRYRARSEIWKVRPVVPSDGDLYDENKQDNTILEFQNANVGDKVFDLPTACVNKEARAVTLAWTRDFGIVWKKNIGFAKCFDPSSDVLYVETDSWEDFFEEPMDTVAGEEDKLVAISSQVTQIAIHQDLLFQKLLSVLPANFDLMLDSYDSLRVFIIILDDPIEAAGSYPRTTSADLREEVPLRIPSSMSMWQRDRGGLILVRNRLLQASGVVDPSQSQFRHSGFSDRFSLEVDTTLFDIIMKVIQDLAEGLIHFQHDTENFIFYPTRAQKTFDRLI